MMEAMTARQLSEWMAARTIFAEDEERAREDARTGKKRRVPTRKVYATPEFADLHMRLWSNAHRWKGPAKA